MTMPHPQNSDDPELQIDSTIIKLAEDYASCDRRSAEINDERATIRANAEKLGIPSKAFQHAVGMVKHMSDGERRDYQVGVNRVLKAISDRQNDLFPVEAEKIRKRQERKASDEASKPRSEAELNAQTDTNERSDPDAGGAKPKTIKEAAAASEAFVADQVAKANKPGLKIVGAEPGQMAPVPGTSMVPPPPPDDEQAEGEAALNAMTPATNAAKKSQSQIAAEKAAAAGITR